MKKRICLNLVVCCFAFAATGCNLDDVKEGEYCPGNVYGAYADDSYHEMEMSDSKGTIMDGDFCKASYPFCNGDYCTKCKQGMMKVKLDDSLPTVTCLSCDELDGCTSNSCENAKNTICKICVNNQLLDYHKQVLKNCDYGCNEQGNECADPDNKTVCQIGEILDEADECQCDEENNWTGESGKCECQAGFHRNGDLCVPNESVITEGDCSNPGEIISDNNTCICDEDNGWSGEQGNCICKENYILIDGKCEEKKSCNTGEKLNEDNNECDCDTANYWIKSDDRCVCMSGYSLNDNDQCVALVDCPEHQAYVLSENACKCDTNNHWIDSDGGCKCADDYMLIGGKCDKKVICNVEGEKLNETNNTCDCDGSSGWVKNSAGRCEKLCDSKKHLEGTTSCSCMFGYKKSDGKCVKYKVGETFKFGKYYINNDRDKEDISWEILESVTGNTDYYLLLSKYGLDAKRFNKPDSGNTEDDKTKWGDSDLYEWLNGGFSTDAFSPEERTRVAHKVSLLGECSGGLCASNTNTVFMTAKMLRSARPTKYAAMKLGDSCTTNECYWWLKTIASDSSNNQYAKIVKKDGTISVYGTYKNRINMVRPIVWVVVPK